MVINATPPSSVGGIQRLAKSIKRELGIPHTKALDEAARQAGFSNFLHAKRQISSAPVASFPVFLTAYWYVKGSVPQRAGRETVSITLSRPLTDLLTARQVPACRNLSGFKMEFADHLELVGDLVDKERALEALEGVARTLRFVDATGLIPAYTQPLRGAMRIAGALPSKDHSSWWVEPSTKEWLVIDEPYGKREGKDRTDWLRDNGLFSVAPAWEGLYFPGSCIPYLVGPSQDLLAKVQAQVESLSGKPSGVVPVASDRYFSQFTSPARAESGKKRRSRPSRSYGDHNGASPYGGGPGVRSQWKPTSPMPLATHTSIGPVLHKLCNSSQQSTGITQRVYEKLNRARSTLEDWAFIEHRNEITREDEEKLYYGPGVAGYSTPDEFREAIEFVRNGVLNGYQDCKPRRDMLALLDGALSQGAPKAGK
ncbi:DUF5623 domain-containing protein [Pseudomonas sp. GOM6]|uniref:DUF5623 domain-containing protein n=1 Tax=Pseudomonas sp. GOM6 TaxID=3036944 RepID=UPI002409AF98|nr:DUF5623 domain-containing protein [Pseudomonas sp. GOM6]MDG1581008.1 DUF5623 domain-containing protein [Pseudomonas sp. GOM6]